VQLGDYAVAAKSALERRITRRFGNQILMDLRRIDRVSLLVKTVDSIVSAVKGTGLGRSLAEHAISRRIS
jgi:hypothetical protein